MIDHTANENQWNDFNRKYYGEDNKNYNRNQIIYTLYRICKRKENYQLQIIISNVCQNYNQIVQQRIKQPNIQIVLKQHIDNHKMGFRKMIYQVIKHMQEWHQKALLVKPNDYKF